MSLGNIFREAVEASFKVDSGCLFNKDKLEFFEKFLQFCKENLGLDELPTIHLLDNRDEGITTGAYSPGNKSIKVYAKKRALIDVMRTTAHELTHYRQDLQERIKSFERDWDLEAEADIEAGKMVYKFAHASPDNKKVYDLH